MKSFTLDAKDYPLIYNHLLACDDDFILRSCDNNRTVSIANVQTSAHMAESSVKCPASGPYENANSKDQ